MVAGEFLDPVGKLAVGAADESAGVVAVREAFESLLQPAGGNGPGGAVADAVAGEGLQAEGLPVPSASLGA